MKRATNVTWFDNEITIKDRHAINDHKSPVIWLTGLSGSGKSTIAVKLESALYKSGIRSMVLDGDNLRHGLNKNLGFSKEDRAENIRRVSELSRVLHTAGIVTIVALISPYTEDRSKARSLFNEGEFIEVFIKCDLRVCEDRDPKGLYQKARSGLLKGFTGIDDEYQVPSNPDLIIDTEELSIDRSVEVILNHVKEYF